MQSTAFLAAASTDAAVEMPPVTIDAGADADAKDEDVDELETGGGIPATTVAP